MVFPVVRTNGRNLFGELSHDLDRLFGQMLDPASSGSIPVDIRTEGDNLLIEAEVPGVAQDQLNITVENGMLTIAVDRKSESEPNANYLVRERRAGSLSRTFRLPETADMDKVEAGLAHGVLTLRIPKKEEAKPRQIPVK